MTHTDTQSRTITLPFDGFYESIHSQLIDSWLESNEANTSDTVNEELINLFYDLDFEPIHLLYAKLYTKILATRLNIPLEFISLHSPRFYNFETDTITASISLSHLTLIYALTDTPALNERIHTTTTACDGYIPYYDPSSYELPLAEWMPAQLSLLLEVYVLQELGDDYQIMDDWNTNGELETIIYADPDNAKKLNDHFSKL
jgi:hypothetical protein